LAENRWKLSWARRASDAYSRVVLDTTTVQIAAQRLYESAGFAEVGRPPIDSFTVVRYEKRLLDRAAVRHVGVLAEVHCRTRGGIG
jgi:hypothetical protein